MSINGIGVDIVSIQRIKKTFIRFGDKFLVKIFSNHEILKFKSIKNFQIAINYLAKRFAAKEAFAKAVGVGFGKIISYYDISTSNNQNGMPFVILNGNALKLFNEKFSKSMLRISLSDNFDYAIATVIIV